MQTVDKNIMDLEVGDIVHFYGARFEVTTTRVVYHRTGTDNQLPPQRSDCVMVAKAKWIDGHIENGYFGPMKDWTFQGNFRVSYKVEK